jgi:glutamate dehydrogenase
VIQKLGFDPHDHSGKALLNVLESYPRDELFQISLPVLSKNAEAILNLVDRPRVRVLPRVDQFDRFVSVLVSCRATAMTRKCARRSALI